MAEYNSINIMYPLCDTDIWVKLSKVNKTDIVFELYNKIYMADCIPIELKKLKNKNHEEFNCGYQNYIKYLGDELLMLIRYNEINEAERREIDRLFIKYDIKFNENGVIHLSKDQGELISYIYAHVLEIPIILSDDKNETINHFLVKRVRLKTLLGKYGLDSQEINRIDAMSNMPRRDLQTLQTRGSINNLNYLCHALKIKDKL